MAGTSPLSRDDPSSSTSSNTLCNKSPNTSANPSYDSYDTSWDTLYDNPCTTSPESNGLVLATKSRTAAGGKFSSFSSTTTACISVASSVASSFDREIAKGWKLTLTLLFLTFLTGMQDAATVPLIDGFASNYSGDLVRGSMNLALTALHAPGLGWLPNVKFATFVISSLVIGHTAHWAGPRTKRWVCFSSLMQAVCLTMGAVVFLILRGKELLAAGRALQYGMVALMCVGGTAQIVMSRTLDRDITTALFTGPTLDLLSDANLFKACRHPREYPVLYKKALMIACAVTGAFTGAVFQTRASAEMALVVSCSLRIIVVVALALAPTEKPADESLPLHNVKRRV